MDGKKKIEIKCKGADTLPIDRILEFQGELKTLSKDNEKKLRNSILKFGFIAPFFVWDDKGEWRLLDGHQRLKTLLKMREEGYDIPLLPVDYIEADSEEDAKRKLLHITSQYGEFSPEGFENFTLDLDGFENIRLTDGEFDLSFLRDDDEVKDDNYEIPDEIETDIKVGDIFQIGEHRLMCGDSTDAEMVAKLMDGQKADMVFTDPPYRMEAQGGSNQWVGRQAAKLGESIKELCDFNPTEFLNRLNELFENNMNAYVFCNKDLVPDYLNWGIDNGYSFNILFWKKPNALPLGGQHRPDTEYLLFFRKNAIWNNGLKDVSYSKCLEFGRDHSTSHPTIKPLELIGNELKISSNEKSLIVDLFGGSGSTLIACEQLKRTCYMMELEPKYCQVIIDRVRAFDGTIEIRRNGELYD